MPDAQPPGLYVHVPFCRAKCPYCDFFSVPSLRLIPDWLAALALEAERFPDWQGTPFDTLYIGGGTPTTLSDEALARLFGLVRRAFRFTADVEVTVEANPEDLTLEKAALLIGLGVNRLSLGVQSFEAESLVLLGRRHGPSETLRSIESARAAGFENLGLDLIYGRPGQTAAAWLKELDQALSFRPEHLSCYQLTFEPKTVFGRMKAEGRIVPPDEERARELFLATADFLAGQGYEQYEVSNFARGVENRSRHNQKYWRRAGYLGLGPSAHSFRDEERWWNVASVKRYCRALSEGASPEAGRETLDPEQRVLEELYLGLRTSEGVALAEAAERPGFEAGLAAALERGLVKISAGRVLPTLEGFLVADRLPLLFVDGPFVAD
jgi:oxygen-independent coproporphyrinogen-3 oxidase